MKKRDIITNEVLHCYTGACLKAEYTAYGSLCFRVNPDIDIYTGAEAACLADGARLASVGSEEEHLFLVDLISK